MSVEFCHKRSEGEVTTDRRGAQWVTDKYLAKVTDEDDGLSVLMRDLPELQRWQRHPIEQGLFVDKFKGTREPNSFYWNITVDYTNSLTPDPLSRPARITCRTTTLDSSTIVDRDGRPIRNSAGDLVLPRKKKETLLIFSVAKDLAPDFPDWLFDYTEHVNADTIRIGGRQCVPNTLYFNGASATDIQTADDVDFRTFSMELFFRRSGWQDAFPSMGFRELLIDEDGEASLVPIQIEGKVATKPQLLDAAGRYTNDPAQVHIMRYDLMNEFPFTGLPLR